MTVSKMKKLIEQSKTKTLHLSIFMKTFTWKTQNHPQKSQVFFARDLHYISLLNDTFCAPNYNVWTGDVWPQITVWNCDFLHRVSSKICFQSPSETFFCKLHIRVTKREKKARNYLSRGEKLRH